jgi:hypothetical protein
MGASNVVGCAGDAAPSRAGPRLNSPCTTRTAAGQRRITTRVMRPFTPRGRGVHTLPFQAHPRVASRPKSPAPAVATLFGLPATLRAGTESVLFPWRCSRRGRTLWVVQTAPQNATRPLEGENPTPVFPSVRASNFRCPCRSTPGPAILSFKRGHSPLSPTAVTKVAETTFAPAPRMRFALLL